MKIVSNDGKYWMEQGDGFIMLGLTPEFKQKLGTIWTFFGKLEQRPVEQGQIFAAVESSKCLLSLRSPVKGIAMAFNPEAMDKPDLIDENTELVKVFTS